jgi:hypothetical protein
MQGLVPGNNKHWSRHHDLGAVRITVCCVGAAALLGEAE